MTLCAVPLEIVEPTAWKQFWKVPPKTRNVADSERSSYFRVQHTLLARKPDHGRAEAALIALYGIRNSRLMTAPPGAQPGFSNNILEQTGTDK